MGATGPMGYSGATGWAGLMGPLGRPGSVGRPGITGRRGPTPTVAEGMVEREDGMVSVVQQDLVVIVDRWGYLVSEG